MTTKERLLAEANKYGPKWLAENPVKARSNPKWTDKDMAAFAVAFAEQQLAEARAQAFKEAAAILRRNDWTKEGEAIASVIERAAEAQKEPNSLSQQKRKHVLSGGKMADFKPEPKP